MTDPGGPSLYFALLGPLTVTRGGREVRVNASKQRIVLAALLLNANRIVPADHLGVFLWGDEPPVSATATIRTYVMRLRQKLGPEAAGRITTAAPGYTMRLSDDETDLGRFRADRQLADRLAEQGRPDEAVVHLRHALSLWRHEPLLDVPSRDLRDIEVQHLRELRLETLVRCIDLELELQRHAALVPELSRLVAGQPLNEAFVARLMRALSRAGRQNEAFALFDRTRSALVEQLGTEPGAELRQAHEEILRPAPR